MQQLKSRRSPRSIESAVNMYRAVVFFVAASLFMPRAIIRLQCFAVNNSRTARSLVDSFEIVDFSNDRYVPRFYLNRPKNRYSHFQSVSDPGNITIYERDQDELYEAESATVQPLSWQDFPQLINNKLAMTDTNGYSDNLAAISSTSNNASKPSPMSNYSNIVPKFPIYFTNPSTGAVYAITEVTRPGDLAQNHTADVFSEVTNYDERNSKYTLHCTMGDAVVKPVKKTLSNPVKKKKKGRKNATKRRPTTVTRHEILPVVQANKDVLLQPKPIRNITRSSLPIKIATRQPPTRASSIFSTRRKITKRMLPATAATNSVISSANKVKTKPKDEHSDYDEFNGFFFEDSSYEDSASDEGQKRKRIKRHQTDPEKKGSNNKTKSLDEGSRSSEEVMDYVHDMMSPIHDVFDILSEKATGLLSKKESKSKGNCSKPHYIMYGSNDGTKHQSWFGSLFSAKEKSNDQQHEAISAKDPGWFDYWDEDYEDKESAAEELISDSKIGSIVGWLFKWFSGNTASTKKQTSKKTTTTSTTTTTQAPLGSEWLGMFAQSFMNKSKNQKPSTPPLSESPDTPRKVSYDGFQIWRLHLKDREDVRTIDQYKHSGEGAKLQWLKGPSLRGPTDLIVPPKLFTDFQGTLKYEGIRHDILLFDLGKAITYDNASKTVAEVYKTKNKYPITWTRYYRYEDIIRFLEYIQMKHPHIVDLIHVGRSYEGRPLIIAKISDKKRIKYNLRKGGVRQRKDQTDMKEVFIEAGSHGREWIGPAVATWIIKELIKSLRSNNTSNAGIKNSTWYILPVLNPDGYEYTHEYDRFWRKSRSRHIAKPSGIISSAIAWLQPEKPEKVCYGVDLNRNWDYKWNQRGSSKSPCNEFYAGPNVYSEPETRAVSEFIKDNRKNLNLFVSLHAYGHLISFPYNISTPFGAQKVDDMMEAARVGMDGLRASGSLAKYRMNTDNDMKASQSGTSDYFAAYRAGIPYSYEIDLSDDGVHGFLLPGSFIEPTSRDAFEIIKSIVDYI